VKDLLGNYFRYILVQDRCTILFVFLFLYRIRLNILPKNSIYPSLGSMTIKSDIHLWMSILNSLKRLHVYKRVKIMVWFCFVSHYPKLLEFYTLFLKLKYTVTKTKIFLFIVSFSFYKVSDKKVPL